MLGVETRVVRDQSRTIQDCLALAPRYVVIGPGPGAPAKAAFSKQLMEACGMYIPVLGVCLGHQALARTYGASVGKAKVPVHGKTSSIFHTNKGVFGDCPKDLQQRVITL